MKIAIVGAGFSGSVIAHLLANCGHKMSVFDERLHVAGNCHTYRDESTNIMVHAYGPHIFHTDNYQVWEFVNRFSKFNPFINRVKAQTQENIFSLPINLHTINQFFNKTFNPTQAREFINQIRFDDIKNPVSFEEQALQFLGKELYEAFFKHYTIKQWGIDPANLPASILKRLPIRFNYNDNYYSSKFQGIPNDGYTIIVEKLLDHPNIKLYLNHKVQKKDLLNFDHIFYSGTLDSWFDYCEGNLRYRTLDFKKFYASGDYQGCAVMNYCDNSVNWTRITEHKHFTPWEQFEQSVCYQEFSRNCEQKDIPYYPIRLLDDELILKKYINLANQESNVTFVGRLGTYRYLDMDKTIEEAFDIANTFINKNSMPPFLIDPFNKN